MGVGMSELRVERLLQEPLGEAAPVGEPGDIVRVSHGSARVYLEPDEFDELSEELVRTMLAKVIVVGDRTG